MLFLNKKKKISCVGFFCFNQKYTFFYSIWLFSGQFRSNCHEMVVFWNIVFIGSIFIFLNVPFFFK